MIQPITITAADQHLIIDSNSPDVLDWATRYFHPWWAAAPAAVGASSPSITATAGDRQHASRIARRVDDAPRATDTTFARQTIRHTTSPDGTVDAYTLDEPRIHLTYDRSTQHLHIHCADTTPQPGPGRATALATATTRFARELLRARLAANGWALLHGSAVVTEDGRALVALGASGAGKTTTALTLAATGAHLLANDCLFARPTPSGKLALLPWPAASAVGIGLLDALGWTRTIREHLLAGAEPHPTQDPAVTRYLTDPSRPRPAAANRELKAHIWPEQLTRWFGLALATTGSAAAVLRPRTALNGSTRNAVDEPPAAVTATDFQPGDSERYPDFLGLTTALGTEAARAAVTKSLNALPAHSVLLTRDHSANAAALTDLSRR